MIQGARGLLLRDLHSSWAGPSPREAQRRLDQYGGNEIRRRERAGHLRALAGQFTHPLALLLWVAAILALVVGIAALAAAIVAVIVLNAVFAFAQELQAERRCRGCCRHRCGSGGWSCGRGGDAGTERRADHRRG